jgi:hypothetical protein
VPPGQAAPSSAVSHQPWVAASMKELLSTSDLVRLSYLRAVLTDAGIETVVLDAGVGSLWGSAISTRLMVDEDDLAQARRLIADAERA